MKALRSAGIPLIIVIVAIVVAVVLTLNKPKPEKKELQSKLTFPTKFATNSCTSYGFAVIFPM